MYLFLMFYFGLWYLVKLSSVFCATVVVYTSGMWSSESVALLAEISDLQGRVCYRAWPSSMLFLGWELGTWRSLPSETLSHTTLLQYLLPDLQIISVFLKQFRSRRVSIKNHCCLKACTSSYGPSMINDRLHAMCRILVEFYKCRC